MENKGEVIKKYRKNKKLTQKELSSLLEISSNHLSLIENNKKGISKKLADRFCKIFDFSLKDKEILYLDIGKKYINRDEAKKLFLKEKELKEKELEIINTYDYIRENHFDLSKRAAINNLLINYFSLTEKLVTNLELKLSTENDEFIKIITPAIKTTVKKLKSKTEDIERMIYYSTITKTDEKGENKQMEMSTFNKILSLIPKKELMKVLTKEQKRDGILTYVAQNLKIKWKEYNVPGCPSGISIRLWEGGRGNDSQKRGFMQHVVSDYIDLQINSADNTEELTELLKEISENIIEHSMVIVEQSLNLARHAKTEKVRRKYLKSMNDQKFLIAALQIGVILYASELKDRGFDINHEYLSLRLDGMKENKRQLNKIWKEFNNSEQTDEDYEKLYKATEEVLKEFEEKRTIDEKQLNKIVEEKMILTLIGEETIEKYIWSLMDNMCQKITGEIRLISVDQF